MKCLGIRKDIVNKQGYHPAGMKPGEEGKCIGCATCAIMCPDGVINVYQE
jgi:2-oxoglutarate ferredoxin oxidoreductase subunit delta